MKCPYCGEKDVYGYSIGLVDGKVTCVSHNQKIDSAGASSRNSMNKIEKALNDYHIGKSTKHFSKNKKTGEVGMHPKDILSHK